MRWAQITAAALVTEAAAHFLSLSWGFALLTVLFVITGIRAQVNTAQTGDLAARHAALVVSVGGVKTTADAALPKAGGTVTGNLTVNGDHTVGGNATAFNMTASNGVTAGSALKINGGFTMPNGSPGAVGNPPNGTGAPAAYAGNFFTGSGAATWAQGVTDAINQIHTLLSNNQITN